MYKCPSCKAVVSFHIAGTTHVSGTVDATGILLSNPCLDVGAGDMEWNNDSLITCGSCNHEGMVTDFLNEGR